MKKLICSIILIISSNYQIIGISISNYQTLGICISNFDRGYGVKYSYNLKKNSIGLIIQYTNKIYYPKNFPFNDSNLDFGKTFGYGFGITNYFHKELKNKLFYTKFGFSYLYKNLNLENFSISTDYYSYIYDSNMKIHEFSLDFAQCFMFKKIEFQLIPKIGTFLQIESKDNVVETYDYYNTHNEKLIYSEKILPRISLDFCINYKF